MSLDAGRLAAVTGMLLGAVACARPNLKDTQKAIRERLLAEAGSDDLIYSRVDFNDCGVSIQTRTPRGPRGEETRTTYTFHATSLDSKTPAARGTVTLTTARGHSSLRRLEQRIDSTGVTESVSSESTMGFKFAQESTAATVGKAFERLSALCRKNNPFKGK